MLHQHRLTLYRGRVERPRIAAVRVLQSYYTFIEAFYWCCHR